MRRLLASSLLLLGVCLVPATTRAQAYCELRDPLRSLYALFPEADAHQSIAREVDEATRREIGSHLPFTLHSTELGVHTLYVARDGGEVLGLVHVRSERSRWGLIEIAWAIGPDLKIVDYQIQRCRSRHRRAVEGGEFRRLLVGRGLGELRGLLAKDGEVNAERLPLEADARELGKAVVRCALKTLVATDVAWGPQLRELGIARSLPAAPDDVPQNDR